MPGPKREEPIPGCGECSAYRDLMDVLEELMAVDHRTLLRTVTFHTR